MKKLFLAILMGALTWSAWGQTRVSGKVTDSAGEPVPGVAVFVRGTTTATVSDANGNYSIVAKEADNLLFSCIGFEETLLPVGKRSIINVTLAESIQELDLVVVTGYQTISKERATGSFDILGKAQIEKPASSIASRLIGAAPGLAYSTDIYGNPSFSIRGTSTFSEYSAPLIVVDGFPVESSFEGINPNDVESVTILKDAAAASIWGAKSSNGVIVITTKNAKATSSGKPVVTVDYSGFYKISPKLDLDYTLSYASSDDVIDYEKAHFLQWDGPLFYSDETDYSGGNSTVYDLLNEVRLGHLTQAQADTQINALRGKSNYDQIRKYMLQNAAVFQQNLGVNIATERSQTALSFIYEDSDRVYKRDEDKRLMISFRNKTNLFKWLDMSVNGTYSRTNSNNSSYGLPDLSPYEMLVDEKGEYIRYSGGVSLNYLKRHVPIEDFPYQDWTFNPVEEMYARELTSTSNLARIRPA